MVGNFDDPDFGLYLPSSISTKSHKLNPSPNTRKKKYRLLPINHHSPLSQVVCSSLTRNIVEPHVAHLLLDDPLLGAGLSLLIRLPLQGRAAVVGALGVHGPLQGVALPAKDVVAVVSEPRVLAVAPEEGLAAVRRPQRLVVELARVEHDLVHELRDLDRMGRGAGAAAFKGSLLRIGTI